MRKIIALFSFFLFFGCANNKEVYWCGDHPCIDKKEREAYFKKNMIVEVKNLDKKALKKNSDIDQIIKQARENEKKRIKDEKKLAKQEKMEEKKRLQEEKELIRQKKTEEKIRLKEEKRLAKQIIIDEKKINKEKKKLIKKKTKIVKIEEKLYPKNDFENIVNEIIENNEAKPYPKINNIPN